MKGIMNRQSTSPTGWKGRSPSSLLSGQFHYMSVARKLCKQRWAHWSRSSQLQDRLAARVLGEKFQTELVRVFSDSMCHVVQKCFDRERRVAVTYRAPLIHGNAGSSRMQINENIRDVVGNVARARNRRDVNSVDDKAGIVAED